MRWLLVSVAVLGALGTWNLESRPRVCEDHTEPVLPFTLISQLGVERRVQHFVAGVVE